MTRAPPLHPYREMEPTPLPAPCRDCGQRHPLDFMDHIMGDVACYYSDRLERWLKETYGYKKETPDAQ